MAGAKLTPSECQQVASLLGREPNALEFELFVAMWSEHCSYKSSKVYLKQLPHEGQWTVPSKGENAGVVDIGDGWVAVFKMESHNHPSFIEPYQGAATGVGGILRDIFTMGAQPIALLNSLRFGPIGDSDSKRAAYPLETRNRYLMERVVAGIAGYGNCVGVPTVGGDIAFDDCYTRNPLVNVFCIGIARANQIVTGKASGVGNPVIYVGSKTGRDGVGGASMASAELGQKDKDRHTVQVGDPFTEKRLIEACMEFVSTGCLVGMQDMGAAGLTSASSEMAARGGVGITLDLSRVPVREEGMTPIEKMISESQERMLLVVDKGSESLFSNICEKWDLPMAIIGEVTDDLMLSLWDNRQKIAAVPIAALTSEAPVYDTTQRPAAPPRYQDHLQILHTDAIVEPKSYGDALLTLLASNDLTCRQWIYEQYDWMVGTNTVLGPGHATADAAVVRVKDTDVFLAVTVDGNGRYCLLNPYQGGSIAVAEAARNLACVGATPIGLTDCLNFGNPEHKETMWQFSACVSGIAEACRQFDIPAVSGNVSFYNETHGLGIYPTPMIGMVGILKTPPITAGFKTPGDLVILIGETYDEIGGSIYLKMIHHQERGEAPNLNFKWEVALQKAVRTAGAQGLLQSAHDCSEGGLAVTLAECCLSSNASLGADLTVDTKGIRGDFFLFGESQSRVIVTLNTYHLPALQRLMEAEGLSYRILGTVGGDHLTLQLTGGDGALRLPVSALRTAYKKGLGP